MACVAEWQNNFFEDHPKKRRRLNAPFDASHGHGHYYEKAPEQSSSSVYFSGNGNGNGMGMGLGMGMAMVPCSTSSSSSHYYYPPHHQSSSSSSLYSKRVTARNASPPWREDDKDGHYVFALGENLTPRYKILNKMGEGTFGQVLECWDRQVREYVAIKIVRSLERYREAAKAEIGVLREIAKYDTTGARCVQMHDWFDYRNHICIVFEKLGPSVFDYLRKNRYHPFPIDIVRDIGRQLLESVAYMHHLHLVHTDLKPENILFVSAEYKKLPIYKNVLRRLPDGFIRLPKSTAIKVIDFGSAIFEDQEHSSIISTRHYRAPEVILGIGWSYPADIWSIGCILVELCSGETLFQTHENLEHLAMMERVLGPIPQHMIRKIDPRAGKYFRHGTRLNFPEGASSKESIEAVNKLQRLKYIVMDHADHSAGLLIDLLQGLLKFEPSERLTAQEALKHPFFREEYRRFGIYMH